MSCKHIAYIASCIALNLGEFTLELKSGWRSTRCVYCDWACQFWNIPYMGHDARSFRCLGDLLGTNKWEEIFRTITFCSVLQKKNVMYFTSSTNSEGHLNLFMFLFFFTSYHLSPYFLTDFHRLICLVSNFFS